MANNTVKTEEDGVRQTTSVLNKGIKTMHPLYLLNVNFTERLKQTAVSKTWTTFA